MVPSAVSDASVFEASSSLQPTTSRFKTARLGNRTTIMHTLPKLLAKTANHGSNNINRKQPLRSTLGATRSCISTEFNSLPTRKTSHRQSRLFSSYGRCNPTKSFFPRRAGSYQGIVTLIRLRRDAIFRPPFLRFSFHILIIEVNSQPTPSKWANHPLRHPMPSSISLMELSCMLGH